MTLYFKWVEKAACDFFSEESEIKAMDNLFELSDSSLFACTLEIFSADDTDPDPAAVHTLGSEIRTALQQEGTIVTLLAPEEQRGGASLLFQVVWQGFQTVNTAVMAQQDRLDVLAALCTIFATVAPLVSHLFRSQKQQGGLKVVIRIDHASVEITSADVADDKHIVQLAQQFLVQHPTAPVSKKSNVKIQAHVSSSKRRRRR